MTHLRKIMLEELQRRHYSEATTRYYIRKVEAFVRYFQCAPDRSGRQHIRECQAYLFSKRKLSPGSVTTHLCALRFFYIQTLKRPWSITDTPYPKKTHRLPTILSQEEVTQLIDAACTPFHRTILMTLYATGVRDAELTRLKVSDIDSRRMVIHIQGGKGRQDRDVMLSPVLLDELRAHWRRLRKKSSTWLFPGNRWHTGARPIDTKTPRHACQYAALPGLRRGCIPTCVTVLPRICSKPAPTCATSRCCSGIATLRRQRSICISPGEKERSANTTAATQRASSGRSRLVSSTAARRCWCTTAISPSRRLPILLPWVSIEIASSRFTTSCSRVMGWMESTCRSLVYNGNRCGNAGCATHRRARARCSI